jgi:hypothetical protein
MSGSRPGEALQQQIELSGLSNRQGITRTAAGSERGFDVPTARALGVQAAPGMTALAGQSEDLAGQPLRGVTLRVGERAVRTDESGRFLLAPAPAGHRCW